MDLTVDELASRSGVSVRTIRFYAGRGLLPPPRLRGRTGLYGPDHLARLELVRELQSLGLTLAAIERHLARIPLDVPEEELALKRALLSPWAPDEPEELSLHELEKRVGHRLDAEALARLVALGAVEEVVEGRVRVLSPALLGITAELADMPLPMETLVAAHEAMRHHTSALADDLQRVFQDTVVRPYRAHGRPAEEREQLLRMATKLKPLTVQAVVNAFQHAVDEAIRRSVPETGEAGDVGEAEEIEA